MIDTASEYAGTLHALSRGRHGGTTPLDGRKPFVAASMWTVDGTLLSEADGLIIRLLPHQP